MPAVPDTPARVLLLKYGELTLKRRNRPRFVNQLRRNLRAATADLGPVHVRGRGGALAVSAPGREDELLERCRALPGVILVLDGVRVGWEADAVARAAVEQLRGRPGATFAVRARRRDKRFPMTSQDLAVLVGDVVRRELGLGVDLRRPDLEVHIEVDTGEVYVAAERIRALGGLPVGSSGRAIALLSGGIDSPVAAYRMMKRGLRCEFVHFSGRPYTGPESILKAYALARRLDRFQGDSQLVIVPFGTAQRALATAGADRLQVLAQRRLMVRTATELARRSRADALVAGDALGQVSSQTVQNLAAVEDAAGLPLLRPLLDRDKAEIMDEARRLGTLEISELPDEDCCQLFAPRRAETKGDLAELRRIDERVDARALVDELLERAEAVRVAEGAPRSAAPGPVAA